MFLRVVYDVRPFVMRFINLFKENLTLRADVTAFQRCLRYATAQLFEAISFHSTVQFIPDELVGFASAGAFYSKYDRGQ